MAPARAVAQRPKNAFGVLAEGRSVAPDASRAPVKLDRKPDGAHPVDAGVDDHVPVAGLLLGDHPGDIRAKAETHSSAGRRAITGTSSP